MNSILIALGIATLAFTASAQVQPSQTIADSEVDRIANAIFRVEGGDKARYSHGIKSVKTRNSEHARQICKRTIINNHLRWTNEGKPGMFLVYLGNAYCPFESDPVGNKNWIRNMRAILKT